MAEAPSEPSSEGEFTAGAILSGKFRIVRLIAQGGMGAVYEGEQLALQRRVAIKTLRSDLAEDQQLRQRFVREGRVAARVQHPNIVEVIDTGEHETTPFLVMELLEGDDLARTIQRRGRLTVAETLDLLLPVCAAIATAHDLGVIHRDIKPENVALVKHHRGTIQVAKLVDFGLSKNLLSATAQNLQITDAGAVLGTPLYMPPEAVLGPAHLDARSDQYSFAVVLFECVTGRTPFVATTLSELFRLVSKGQPPRPSALAPNIAPAFEAALLRAMHVERARRFGSMWDLGAALLSFASERTRNQWAETFSAGSRRSLRASGLIALDQESRPASTRSSLAVKIGAAGAVAMIAFAALRWTLVAPAPTVAPVHSERDASQTEPQAPLASLSAREGAHRGALDARAPDASGLDASDARSLEAERDGGSDGRSSAARSPRDAGRRRPSGEYQIL